METRIVRVQDFEVSGDGSAASWGQSDWQALQLVGKAKTGYATRFKTVYSAEGLYFLFDCEDRRLTCSMTGDFMDIFREDVIEVFLWPDEAQHLYFEYEISPLNVELPILVPNCGRTFMGWRPWHYEGERRTRKATSVRGGKKEPMAAVEGWMAEFCIPFSLLRGLGNNPPESGTRWRANMYRVDYDSGEPVQWAWCEKTGTHFHDYRQFGTIMFE